MLQLDDVHAYYSSSHALQGVSMRHDGGIIAILGRNGAGKTTLARSVMGLVPTARGRIVAFGNDVTNARPYEVAKAGLGYVPQGRQVFASLTVHEHLQMLERPGRDGWTTQKAFELFPRLAERRRSGAGLLSGGEQQMLAITRALMTNPRLLLMDEPSEGLAPVIIDSLVETFRKLAAAGMGILLIEQNLHLAEALVDETLIMISGRIEDRVATDALLRDQALRERYLGVRLRV